MRPTPPIRTARRVLQDEFDGNPVPPVTDDDPSRYYGAADPSIDIEKDTNGNQADTIAEQDHPRDRSCR